MSVSHKKASTDPGKDLHLYSRIGMYNEIVFSFFNEDGSDYDLSAVTLAAGVKRNRGDEDLITLEEGDGITVTDNDVRLVFNEAESAEFKERPYYWQLRRTIDSKEKVWLNGAHDWHNGKFDAFNNAGETITITDGSEVVTVTIQESGGSVTLAVLGETLEEADSDTPLNPDTFYFFDFVDQILKKSTWTSLKTLLTTFFNGIYVKLTLAADSVIDGIGQYTFGYTSDDGTSSTTHTVTHASFDSTIADTDLERSTQISQAADLISFNALNTNTGYGTGFSIQDGVVLVTGSDPAFTGLKYNADYSANYVARSLVDKNYVDAAILSAVVGLMDYRGVFDASVNAYPSSGGSGTAGAILKSDFWIISVAGTLPTGLIVSPGDLVIAKQDTPGNTEANWNIVQYNIGYTPENAANKATTFGTVNDTLYPSVEAVTEYAVAIINTAVALTDGAAITLTAAKHTLTTDEATVTITDNYAGDFLGIEVILSGITATTWTLPANSLGAYNGAASGNNTIAITGAVSGDRIVFSRWKCGSNYSWVAFNFGQ